MNKKICLLVGLIMLLTLPLLANNIAVGTVTITDQSTVGDQPIHYTHLQFDISWENSWRTSSAPNNYDAAWVFAKWKLHSETDWAHCTLASTDLDHTAPTGSTIDAASDGTGIFIYRDDVGSGSNNWDNAKLRWNYGTDVADDATVDVKVFAIEMVYVPQGNFYVGDTTSTCRFHNGDNQSESFQVTSSQITLGTDDGELWAIGSWTAVEDELLQTDYPTGFDAFYCMKYEISQGQYADFLNTLTYYQQNTRTSTTPSSTGQVNENKYRNGLEVQTAGTDNTVPAVYGIDLNNDDGNLGSNIACNYLNWADVAAYSDWSGLRPMTELEFEKAGRGTLVAVANEYAWGSTTISGLETGTGNRVENDGLPNESSTSSTDNCHYNNSGTWDGGGGPYGPVRCGFFAESGTSRETSGASYYGIMEMSGNLFEHPVTVGNTEGRTFTGTNGNGVLASNGDADVPHWPGALAKGAGFRGGAWIHFDSALRLSGRVSAASEHGHRDKYLGGRGVRGSP